MFYKPVTLHRLIQTITWRGEVYEFYRKDKNEYGEKTEELQKIAQINGLFHNGSSNYIKIVTADAGMTINKTSPFILMSWGNAEKLQLEDVVEINGNTYKVTGKDNISQLNIAGEVSLEVLL